MAARASARIPAPGSECLRVVMLAMPMSEAIDVVASLDILLLANNALRRGGGPGPGYAAEVVAAAPGPICAWGGLTLTASRPYQQVRGPIDTLVVGSVDDPGPLTRDERLVRWIRDTGTRARRVVALCTGAFLLAEAGVLDGRRATTHWTFCSELARRYPSVAVDPEPIFVRDGNVYTSAGSTASMDVMLAAVEEDFGRRVALAVATNLVLFLKRPGGQAQFSAQLSTQLAEREPLRELQAWIADHPGDPLTVPALAGRVAMSPRNFFRVFTHEVGVTPARFVQRARVEAACRLLQDTRRSADEIAAQCGFGSAETMRGAFQRALRTSPQAYRARFDAAPDGQRRHALDERGSLMDRMRRPAHDRLR